MKQVYLLSLSHRVIDFFKYLYIFYHKVNHTIYVYCDGIQALYLDILAMLSVG